MFKCMGRRAAAIAAALAFMLSALPAFADEAGDTGIVGAYSGYSVIDQFMASGTGTHKVTASLLNVRSGPASSYSVIGKLKRGAQVNVTAIQGDFCRIESGDGTVGYVARQYLTAIASSATTVPTAHPTSAVYGTYRVTASLLNVRSGAGTGYSVVEKIKLGTVVGCVSESGQWMQVRLPSGRTGWLMKRYVTYAGSQGATTAPTATPAPTATAAPTAGSLDGLEAGDIYITTANVNLRSGPGTSYSTKRVLTGGTYITLKNKYSTDWYFVRTSDGIYGYVKQNYLRYSRTIQPTPSPAPTQAVVDTSKQLYSYAQMKEDIQKLFERYPNMVTSRVSIGNTMWNEQIPAVCIGNYNAGKALLIDGGIHGREYMSTLLIMEQMEYLLENQNTMYGGRTIGSMLNECCIWFVPMINPDGVRISQTGLNGLSDTQKSRLISMNDGSTYFDRWKANGFGVDLNRNFESGWVRQGSPSSEQYSGTSANSESETQAMVSFVRRHTNIKASINYHTTGNCIYWHYGQTGQTKSRDKAIAQKLSGITGYYLRDENYTGKGGGFMDWMIDSRHLPSFTLELGNGNISAPQAIQYFPAIWSANRDVPAMMLKYIIENL